jgi:serine/threonine protein kinase
LNILTQLISALKYCHSKEQIHLGLKPENIMITSDFKTIKIIDFRFSTLHISENNFLTTALYQSPEFLNLKQYTCSTDIWSLGVILYEMITLQYPFDFTSLNSFMLSIMTENKKKIGKNCNINLESGVLQMMCVDCGKRISIDEIEKLFLNLPPNFDTSKKYFDLGLQYFEGKDITQDLVKSQKKFQKSLQIWKYNSDI